MKCNFLVLMWVAMVSICTNLVFQEKANAWVDVCNNGSTRISRLAVGYSQSGDWESKGWWDMNPGECRRVYQHDLTANTDQTRHKSNKLKVLSRKDYIWQHIR